jgi:hypothetical protein
MQIYEAASEWFQRLRPGPAPRPQPRRPRRVRRGPGLQRRGAVALGVYDSLQGSNTALYTSLAILHTEYTGWRDNDDLNVYAQARAVAVHVRAAADPYVAAARLGINPIVTLEKQLLDMIGNLV